MKNIFLFLAIVLFAFSCRETEPTEPTTDIYGYNILNQLPGLWLGTNSTAFGPFDFFPFDFRPISASHVHSISEGATAQSIVNSLFVADYNGEQVIMARNGGWLGQIYRSAYYQMDSVSETSARNYYRLSDAIGGKNYSYMEFIFEGNGMIFRSYTSNSGTQQEATLHMDFQGTNINAQLAENAARALNYPQTVSEINLSNAFDPNVGTATFFEEADDPYRESEHPYVSDLDITFTKDPAVENAELAIYLSAEPIVDANGNVNFDNLNESILRALAVNGNEEVFECTYVHPGTYYGTAFNDTDGNAYPSSGEFTSQSTLINIDAKSRQTLNLVLDIEMP